MSVNYPYTVSQSAKMTWLRKCSVSTWEKKIPAVQQPLLRNIAISDTELSFVSSARNTGNPSKKTVKVSFYFFLLPCCFVLFACLFFNQMYNQSLWNRKMYVFAYYHFWDAKLKSDCRAIEMLVGRDIWSHLFQLLQDVIFWGGRFHTSSGQPGLLLLFSYWKGFSYLLIWTS